MKGKIVRYNFLGLDHVSKEVYSLDYAIVLEATLENGLVRILPFTNKFIKESIESFCINKIDGFIGVKNEGFVTENQYVLFDKMIEVKNEELYPVYKQNVLGNLLKDPSGKPIQVILNDLQMAMIDKKYNQFEEGEEKSVINLLLKADACYDIDMEHLKENEILKLGYKKLDKYKEYNFNNQKIIIFFIENERYSVIMNKGEFKDLNIRNEKLKALFSVDMVG